MEKSFCTKTNPVAPVSTKSTVRTERLFNDTVHHIIACFPSMEPSSTQTPNNQKPEIGIEYKERESP